LSSSNVKVAIGPPASFFNDATDIDISGVVVVTHNRRRRLASPRTLEVESDDEKFDVKIKVAVDGNSASLHTMMMSTFIFGVTALLFV